MVVARGSVGPGDSVRARGWCGFARKVRGRPGGLPHNALGSAEDYHWVDAGGPARWDLAGYQGHGG
jgi:hypothetical protein